MLKHLLGTWNTLFARPLLSCHTSDNNSIHNAATISSKSGLIKLHIKRFSGVECSARRRIIYDDDEEEEDEEYGHNEELAMLEMYSQSARDEALLVKAIVDDHEVEVLIFKGFSSCLSYKTSSDPSKSVLPARAVIKRIDRIKGPFDPSNIEYLERGLTWEAFKGRLQLM